MLLRPVRVLLTLLAAFAIGCARPLPELPPIQTGPVSIGAGEWRVTNQVIVLTDASGTQYDNGTFPEAKSLTRSFVAVMPANDAPAKDRGGYEAGLVGFGGEERSSAPLAPFDRGALASVAAGLMPLGSIDGMGGYTPIHHVLTETKAQLEGGRTPGALVVFSDGLPDDADWALANGGKLVEARPDLCIHTVQTGDDPAGTAFLTALSGLSACGSHRSGSSLSSAGALQSFAKTVFVGPADAPPPPPPPVAKPVPAPPPPPDPCKSVVRLRGIEFEFDKAEILPVSRPILDVVADQLRQCPAIRVSVDGHTDAIGSDAYNQALSLRRAQATRNYLVEVGIDAGRLSTQGFGESRPVDTNDTPSGRARNRRVELSPLP